LERKPIHLLLVSNTDRGPFVGGADRDWVNLLNALGPDEVRVTWVGTSGSEELRKYIDPRVLVRTIDIVHPCFYDLVPDNAYTPKSRWLWSKIMLASSLGLGRSFFQLRHALRSEPVDIVVTNTVVVLLGAFFAKLTRRPHVWNIKEHLDPQVKACRRFANVITRLSSAVVVPSRAIGEAFSSRLHVFPDGGDIGNIKSRVTSSRQDVLKRFGLPADLPMVAQVGAISQRKGQHLTAEAFVNLAHRGGPPAFSLVFFGKGNPQETERVNLILSQAPQEWRDVVKFAVFEDDDFSLLAAADIVVHPSTFQDAFPNAVREAMTLGKPVIASALGGMLDMIVDGVNGLLVTPNDANVLAAALDRLLLMPDLRRQLGANAEVFARDNFDIHLRKLAFLDLLKQLATSKQEVAPGASE
jgi:glycosyltransferase involved in cell wall biosynthesis